MFLDPHGFGVVQRRHVPLAWKSLRKAADELIVDLGVSTSFGPTTRSKHGLKILFRTCLWARKEVSLPPPPQNRFTKLEWTMLTSMVKETATKGVKNQCPKADFLVGYGGVLKQKKWD